MKAVRFIAIFSFLLVFGCASISAVYAQETKDTKTEEKSSTVGTEAKNPVVVSTVQAVPMKDKEERYRIGMHDVIDITVYKHPELSQANIRMDEDGRIRLPRLDTPVIAICKTENELAKDIIEMYKKNYLRDPFVSVVVKEQNSQPLSVIGAVEKPGAFYTQRRLTLLELLSFAGGPNERIAGTKVQVARVGGISGCAIDTVADGDENLKFFSYELADVLKGKTNPVMKPGDIVHVMKAEEAYVTGNVVRPQTLTLQKKITLSQAIAAGGGFLPATKKSQVKLIRQEPGSQTTQTFTYDLNAILAKKVDDPVLIANDVVFVPTDKVKEFTTSFIRAITGGVGTYLPYRLP